MSLGLILLVVRNRIYSVCQISLLGFSWTLQLVDKKCCTAKSTNLLISTVLLTSHLLCIFRLPPVGCFQEHKHIHALIINDTWNFIKQQNQQMYLGLSPSTPLPSVIKEITLSLARHERCPVCGQIATLSQRDFDEQLVPTVPYPIHCLPRSPKHYR